MIILVICYIGFTCFSLNSGERIQWSQGEGQIVEQDQRHAARSQEGQGRRQEGQAWRQEGQTWRQEGQAWRQERKRPRQRKEVSSLMGHNHNRGLSGPNIIFYVF